MESIYSFIENKNWEKRSDHAFIINYRPNTWIRLRINEVSQVERFLFSKLHLLVRDDKDVIVQTLPRFGKVSEGEFLPWVF